MFCSILRAGVQPFIRLFPGLCPLAVMLAFAAHAAGPYGTDNGWAIDNSGHTYITSSLTSQLTQAETGWIRIEMRLIPGHTNWDSAMLAYYDTAVNNACNAGLQVLLLIDGGSWPGNQSDWEQNAYETNSARNGDNNYVEGFATNAVVPIVQHFHNRVKVYELWNEPNAWTSSYGVGGTFMYPSNFGWLLARSWEAIHKTYGYNDVTLFSGGVFGHDISGVKSYGNAGAQYIDDTYSTGTNTAKGDSFAYIHSKYGVYPLDGVGEHIYLDTGGATSGTTFRQYEDWVRQAYTKYEGASTTKKTFITEFGWQTPSNGNPSPALQDSNLVTAFTAIQATPYVQMAIWFQFQDNPAGGLYYGVLDSSNNPKLSYADYKRFERFEGMYSSSTTNTAIASYYTARGQAQLGNPFDNGHGAWVYSFLNGQAQDFTGGAHSNVTVMTSSNGTYELNDLHGLWSYYQANNGPTNYGYALNSEYTVTGGTRQDFSLGYLTCDSTHQVAWHANPSVATLTATPNQTGSKLVINWTGSYILQSATNILGPFINVTGATSPYTNSITQPQQYFRLLQ